MRLERTTHQLDKDFTIARNFAMRKNNDRQKEKRCHKPEFPNYPISATLLGMRCAVCGHPSIFSKGDILRIEPTLVGDL